jgi:hypothetical protein
MAAASRESESFKGFSPIIGWNSDRRGGYRHSLSKTESPPVKRIIAQVLIAVREIAARRKSASQRASVNQWGATDSDRKNLAPRSGRFTNHLCLVPQNELAFTPQSRSNWNCANWPRIKRIRPQIKKCYRIQTLAELLFCRGET